MGTSRTVRVREPLSPIRSPWVVDRPRLFEQLDEASTASRVVVVRAPSGSGKTALIASWTAARQTPVRWLGAHMTDLLDAPAQLDVSAAAARSAAQASVVVLDGLTPDSGRVLTRELDRLLRASDPSVRIVLLTSTTPRLDLQQLGVAGAALPLTADDLAMTKEEISDALSRMRVNLPVAGAVARHTQGWACGVRLAALHLQRSITPTEALRETDRAIEEYLDTTVLSHLSTLDRDLLIKTSLADEADPELARIVGACIDVPRLRSADRQGFIEVRADGSFRCHPLLRRVLRRRLLSDPSPAREIARRTATWLADQGRIDEAVDVSVETLDFAWTSELLVENLAVPRSEVLGRQHPVVRPELAELVKEVEPLLAAVAAIQQGWPDAADDALEHAVDRGQAGNASPAAQLSLAVLLAGRARARGDRSAGLVQVRRALTLMTGLSARQRSRAPELDCLLQSHLGAFELWSGRLDQARHAFERGARPFRPRPAQPISLPAQMAAAACLGQLAWLESISGELSRASLHAAQVLTARPADSAELGVVHAQLATMCVQIARGEFDEAEQRFGRILAQFSGPGATEPDPGLAAAIALAAVRIGAAVGDGSTVRAGTRLDPAVARSAWFADQLRLARADNELAAGQPTHALQMLKDIEHLSADLQILRARAFLILGDLASVGAALRLRPVEAVSVSTQIQLELMEASLAHAHGDGGRQRVLIDRALRAAQREQLRTPIAWAKTWLQPAIATDATLLRLHGTFIASIRSDDLIVGPESDRRGEMPRKVELSQRELDILQRLGSLSTNNEIAADLYLSTNTVKTHLKSLYRKLDVTRRSEAFRRGRNLGLC